MRALFLTLLMVIFSFSYSFSSSMLPEVKKDCFLCHVLNQEGTGVALQMPINDLCLSCHPGRREPSEHKVDVVPKTAVKYLPLSEGKVTCVSCHDPHGFTGINKMLRAEPGKLCFYCHAM